MNVSFKLPGFVGSWDGWGNTRIRTHNVNLGCQDKMSRRKIDECFLELWRNVDSWDGLGLLLALALATTMLDVMLAVGMSRGRIIKDGQYKTIIPYIYA